MSKTKIKENSQNETNTSASKKKIIIVVLILAVIVSVVYFFASNDKNKIVVTKETSGTAYEFKKEGELTFINSEDKILSQIDIEIAATEEERTQGLMFRDKMTENYGMLFIFETESPQSFWMKNTLISLDIIFINKENLIVKIHKNTKTLSEQSYPSGSRAIYVVEVNAGYCDKYGIKENDKIVWRRN